MGGSPLIGQRGTKANLYVDRAPIVQVPTTPVYVRNIEAIDSFLGVSPRDLSGVAAGKTEVANRFGPLLKHLDGVFDASLIRHKARRILVEERWWNRTYSTPAYVFGRTSRRTQSKPSLILTAGIHGDETGAVHGMVDVMTQIANTPDLLERFEPIVIVPCVHPANLDLGVRELVDGRDPNRLFYSSDATRPASIRSLEALALEFTTDEDALVIDLHQDDRFAPDAVYALYGNERSRAIAHAAVRGTRSTPVTVSIDGADNDRGVLRKNYEGSFSVPPVRAADDLPPVELVLEANDATQFWPGVEAAMNDFSRDRSRDER